MVFVYMSVGLCVYTKVSMEALDQPGAEVTGSCEPPNVGPGNQIQIREAACTEPSLQTTLGNKSYDLN